MAPSQDVVSLWRLLMKALKILILAIVGILGLLLLIAAFLPSEYRVERSVVIAAEPDVVFDYVADFQNWSAWSPWEHMDPEVNITITDPSSGVGAVMSWDGAIMGQGNLTFTEVRRPEEVRSTLVFTDPFEMSSTDVWKFEKFDGGTKLSWSDEGTLSWPIERWLGLTLDGQLGPDFELGLANIKRVVESAPPPQNPGPPPSDIVPDPTANAGIPTD